MDLKTSILKDINEGASYEDIIFKYGHDAPLDQLDGIYYEIVNEMGMIDGFENLEGYKIDTEPAFWYMKAKKEGIIPYNIIDMFNMINEGKKQLIDIFDREIYITHEIGKKSAPRKSGDNSEYNFALNRRMGQCVNSNFEFLVTKRDDFDIVNNLQRFNERGFLYEAAKCRLEDKDGDFTTLDLLRFDKREGLNANRQIADIISGGNKTCQEVFFELRNSGNYRPLDGHYYHTDLYLVTIIIELFKLVKYNRSLDLIYDARNMLEVCKQLIK